jgi:hypothetical protein
MHFTKEDVPKFQTVAHLADFLLLFPLGGLFLWLHQNNQTHQVVKSALLPVETRSRIRRLIEARDAVHKYAHRF